MCTQRDDGRSQGGVVTRLFLTVANSGVLLICFFWFSAEGGESTGGTVKRMREVARVTRLSFGL